MSLSDTLPKRLAIWAIDPFEREVKPEPNAIQELKQWSNQLNMKIQPVHILRFTKPDLLPNEPLEVFKKQTSIVKKSLIDYLGDFHISHLRDPQVIVENTSSIHKQVDSLIEYAHQANAQWIIVSSKGLSGLRRMVVGSFTETLLLRSPLPVWVFGHGDFHQLDLRKILFATDFSDSSKEALAEVVRQAKETHSEIILFHKVILPQVTQSAMMGSGIPIPATYIDDYFRDQKKWAEETADQWKNHIKSFGIQNHSAIDTGIGQVHQSILDYSKICGAGVIAMASQSSPVSAAFLGSNAREVIRKSESPVWVFGPKCIESAQSTKNKDIPSIQMKGA